MAIDIGTVDYNQAIAAVTQYYQTDPGNVINIINEYNMTPEQLYELLPTTDKVWNTTYSNSGAILGTDTIANIQYAGATQAAEAAAAMDSNVATATQATKTLTNIPAQSAIDSQTGNVTMSRGVTSAATGSTFLAVADKISLGVVGVSIGAKLGAFIDGAIYSAAPDYWDATFPDINPQTWDDIATTQGGKQFIRGLFGISGDTSAMYIPEDIFAYYALAMAKEGFFTDNYETSQDDIDSSYLYRPDLHYNVSCAPHLTADTPNGYHYDYSVSDGYIVVYKWQANNVYIYGCSLNPGQTFTVVQNGSHTYTRQLDKSFTRKGVTFYYNTTPAGNFNPNTATMYEFQPSYCAEGYIGDSLDSIIIALLGTTVSSSVPGVTPQPGATFPVIDPNASIADVLAQLKSLYPDLWDKALTESVVQPDGTTKTYTYVPMPVTDTSNLRDPEPTNTTVTQDDYIVDPTTTPQDILDTITRYLTGTQQLPDGETVPLDPTENPPDTGSGDTPDVVLPVGNASALWSVYNPTLAEINSFGSWLWSSNFIDQLLKMFNDPMQSIIGLHKIFVPPITGGVSNIVVGYLDSGVPANTVPTQYASLDCGSINLLEYFGNVFDYSPFTRVYIYLPFIGFRELDTALVMRSTINVTYHADMYTGAGLAEISAIRDSGSGGVVYQFSCDLAAKYPLSQGSYMGIVASIATLATGILSGNPLLTASSAISAVGSAKTKTEMSGSFTGNSGALGIKKPYLIIIRPQSQIANGYNDLQGNSDNTIVNVGDVSGYARFTDIELINVDDATIDELQEIESYLINGIHI